MRLVDFDLNTRIFLNTLIDFIYITVNLTWTFNPHPDNPEWTLITDTISNDFSYGMSLLASKKQISVHDILLTGIQEKAPLFKMDLE